MARGRGDAGGRPPTPSRSPPRAMPAAAPPCRRPYAPPPTPTTCGSASSPTTLEKTLCSSSCRRRQRTVRPSRGRRRRSRMPTSASATTTASRSTAGAGCGWSGRAAPGATRFRRGGLACRGTRRRVQLEVDPAPTLQVRGGGGAGGLHVPGHPHGRLPPTTLPTPSTPYTAYLVYDTTEEGQHHGLSYPDQETAAAVGGRVLERHGVCLRPDDAETRRFRGAGPTEGTIVAGGDDEPRRPMRRGDGWWEMEMERLCAASLTGSDKVEEVMASSEVLGGIPSAVSLLTASSSDPCAVAFSMMRGKK